MYPTPLRTASGRFACKGRSVSSSIFAHVALSIKLGKVVLDGTATNCVIISMSGSCLGGTGAQHKSLKSFERHKPPAAMTSSPRKTSRLPKIPM
jgi:hypothetical protein